MCGKNIYRPVIVEGRVKTHPGADTGPLDLPFVIYFCSNCVPGKYGNRRISTFVDETVVDGPGYCVGIYCSGRCFKVGIVAVDQLVPETGAVLVTCEPFYMCAKLFEYLVIAGVCFR